MLWDRKFVFFQWSLSDYVAFVLQRWDSNLGCELFISWICRTFFRCLAGDLQKWSKGFIVWNFMDKHNPYHPCDWYIYLHLPYKSTIHLGTYASPMHGMGNDLFHHFHPGIPWLSVCLWIYVTCGHCCGQSTGPGKTSSTECLNDQLGRQFRRRSC